MSRFTSRQCPFSGELDQKGRYRHPDSLCLRDASTPSELRVFWSWHLITRRLEYEIANSLVQTCVRATLIQRTVVGRLKVNGGSHTRRWHT